MNIEIKKQYDFVDYEKSVEFMKSRVSEIIVESKEDIANNQTAAKNDGAKNVKSNIDRSSIKIIDFDELKKREPIHNKQRIEKIKVVYFD